jgi:hypothetical protein
LQVTVPTPSFTLAQNGSPAVAAGSATATAINVVGANGFSGAVTLSASGLPSGVTAAFSSSSATSSSQLTLNASKTAAPGSYSVVVKGVSGSLSGSVTVPFTVTKSNTK